MMKHAWDGYAKYAWGKNEVKPASRRAHTGSVFGSSNTGASIVDGMDTLYIMGLMDEFEKGKEWIRDSLDLSAMVGLARELICLEGYRPTSRFCPRNSDASTFPVSSEKCSDENFFPRISDGRHLGV